MYTRRRIIKCPSCEKFLGNFVCLSKNNFDRNDLSKKCTMASDGCDWAMEAIDPDNYVMCSECQNVFNSDTGNGGETTVYHIDNHRTSKKSFFKKNIGSIFSSNDSEEEDNFSKRDVIVDGLELHKKALQLVGRNEKERYSILLKYIWEIERLDKDKKSLCINDYDEALSEILEILGKKDDKNPRSTRLDDAMILQWNNNSDDLERAFEEERSMKQKHYNTVSIIETLLIAEFFRRKGMFDRAIDILNANGFIFSGNYKKLADEMMCYSKDKNPELFYMEIENSNCNELEECL